MGGAASGAELPLRISTGSATVQGSRPYQEDRSVCIPHPAPPVLAADAGSVSTADRSAGAAAAAAPRWWLGAVYDGHGGARASEYCVRELHSSLFKQLPPRLNQLAPLLKQPKQPTALLKQLTPPLKQLPPRLNQLAPLLVRAPTPLKQLAPPQRL